MILGIESKSSELVSITMHKSDGIWQE